VEKIRVLIADDHPAFREGLCQLLEHEEDLECVAEAADGEEAVRLAIELLPDVAIIDIAMPKLNGIEAAAQNKAARPAIAILMVSAFGYESYILASLRAGAAGYLLKNAPLRELTNAIRSVHAGEAVFDLKATSKILRRLVGDKGEERIELEELHPRELEVLRLIGKGMSNKEIARELVISERTVQTHLVNVFRKLDVGSRTEAVLHALREGWLTLDDLP
jgi:DNA-binding NarL/FixJ family response regulator